MDSHLDNALYVENGKLMCPLHGTHNIGKWADHPEGPEHQKDQIAMRHILYVAFSCRCGSDDILIDEEQ